MSELTDYEKLRQKPSLFVSHILGVEPFGYQQEFLDTDKRHRVVSSGRQVGKSRMAAWIGLHHALTRPHEQVLITAPSLRQSSLLFKTLYSEIDQSGMSNEEWGIDRDTQTIIEFDNGSSIHCLPTGEDGNKIRGFTADLIIVDEAAFIADEIFEEILKPMTFATQGKMVLASTPYGKSGYFYKKFAGATGDSNWMRQQVSSYDNPLVDEEDLEEYKQGKTDAQIKREVYGQFVEDSGQFFPSDAISNCFKPGEPRQKSDHAYLGADIAGDGSDRTVFYGVDDHGNVFLHDEVYDEMGVLEAAGYIKTLDTNYHFDRIFVDRTAIGQGTIEKLANDPTIERKIEPIYFTVQKKQQIYQRLKAAMEAGVLHIPQDRNLRDELESIGSNKTRSGNLKLFPRGSGKGSGRDDHVDALALACWGMSDFGGTEYQGGSKTPVFGSSTGQSMDSRKQSVRSRRQKRNASRSVSTNTRKTRPNRRR